MSLLSRVVASTSPGNTRLTRWEAVAVLNVYGNAVLLAALAVYGVAGALWVAGAAWWTPAIPCLPATALVVWGVRITRRLPRKVRIATALLRRVAAHGYQAELFANTCGDLCMRRLTWLVLEKSGHYAHFKTLVETFRGRASLYIEHSSPELEALINSGAISEQHVRTQIVRHLALPTTVLLVATLLLGNACVETVVASRTASVPHKEHGTSSKKVPLTEVHATRDGSATATVVRGDVTVTVDVVPELSRPLPPIG